jgi:hypothetical protein
MNESQVTASSHAATATTGDVRSSLIHAVNRRVAPMELSGEA